MARRNVPIEKIDGLPERLKKCRNASDYTMDYMANELNISKSAYRGYEIGLSEPCLSDLIKMSILYDVSVDFLLGISNELEEPLQSKNWRLLKLQSLVEKIKLSGDFKNHAKIVRLINNMIDYFNKIIEKNIDVVNYPEADENLAGVDDFFNDGFFEDRNVKKNSYNTLVLDGLVSYDNLVASRDMLKLIDSYVDAANQSFSVQEAYDIQAKLNETFMEIRKTLETNIFSVGNDK